ncbi:MAG: Nif3-like dinuclear metal center hexameric protein [Bacteroidales bacterium]|nr:Nif3-like dinuclear metal center hexameric protein [Bacteroidales bacterium]
MKLDEITAYLESLFPLDLQESYDNSGLIIGSPFDEINKVLIALDITDEIIEEALENKCELIIAHHPLIFGKGITKLNTDSVNGGIIKKAIQNNISIYAIHTNLDNSLKGLNYYLASRIGLNNIKILSPEDGILMKLVSFCPTDKAEEVRQALFAAGAGNIGNYDCCSFNIAGQGTFRGGENTNPYVGEKGKLHFENEIRIETIFPSFIQGRVVNALLRSHPYEEVAYDLYPLANRFSKAGSGIVGELNKEEDVLLFMNKLKEIFDIKIIRHSKIYKPTIKKVAICSGSGAFLINKAIAVDADIFITADLKYHDFFNTEKKIIIADIGHYESEIFVKDVLFELLYEKFPNFAVLLSKLNSNPVYYF